MGVIRLRAGQRAAMPPLADRELVYVRDEQALYIGTEAGSVQLCAASAADRLTALESGKLTAVPAARLSPLAADASAADTAAAYNALLSALTAAGIMEGAEQKGEDP